MFNKKNPYNIEITAIQMGSDYLFIITGGKAHIGATATAYWTEEILNCQLIELPHHKEGEVAKNCALYAANILNCTVTVTIGIHIDHATKEQIYEIVDYVQKTMSEKVNFLENDKNTPN